MRHFTLFCILFLAGSVGCLAQENSSIKGVWQMAKGEYRTPGNTFEMPATPEARHMKTITDGHFSTVWVDPSQSAKGYPGFNGGTYTLENGIYTEHHQYFANPERIGKKSYYKVSVKGDRLFLSPVTEDGQPKKFGFFEEWKRLE